MKINDIEISKLITRRFRKMRDRSLLKGFNRPIKTELDITMRRSIDRGFRCCYCNHVMSIDYSGLFAATFDHIVSLSNGGSQSSDNLQIICVCCNHLKATYSDETYKTFIKQTTHKLRLAMWKEKTEYLVLMKNENLKLKKELRKSLTKESIEDK